jgi:hypothetical protein
MGAQAKPNQGVQPTPYSLRFASASRRGTKIIPIVRVDAHSGIA